MAWQTLINSRGKLWDYWNDNPRQAIQLTGEFPGFFWICGNIWGIEENLHDARKKVIDTTAQAS